MSTKLIAEAKILNAEFVGTQFFLARVVAFEKQYDMRWFIFESEFNRHADWYRNKDYNEWAFLIRNYRDELTAIEAKAPPGGSCEETREKPDFESGFFIWWLAQNVRSESTFRGDSCHYLRLLAHSRDNAPSWTTKRP